MIKTVFSFKILKTEKLFAQRNYNFLNLGNETLVTAVKTSSFAILHMKLLSKEDNPFHKFCAFETNEFE